MGDRLPQAQFALMPAGGEGRREIIFIDGQLPDRHLLREGIAPGVEIVVLEGDGLRQIADHLQDRSNIDAIHILSHGEPGRVQLGDRWLDEAGVEADAALLAEIGYALTDGGDILVYGCRVAMDDHGKAFVQALASATDANVAASRNLTGSTVLGGDWVLEEVVGALSPRTQVLQADYPHVLATLQAGDIVVLGINQIEQKITFATLVDIPAGTVLKITDKGWDQATNAFTFGNPLNTSDGVVTWTVSSTIGAGTLLTLSLGGSDNDPETALTDVTGALSDLTGYISLDGFAATSAVTIAGEQVFIYQDDASNPFFIFGLNASRNTNLDGDFWQTSITAPLTESMIPNGVGSQNALTNGVNAVGILTNPGGGNVGQEQFDNVFYNGPTTQTDKAGWLARITNAAHWTGDDTGTGATSIGVISGSSLLISTNTVPTATNLTQTVSYTEDAGGTVALGDIGVTDADVGDTITATLTLSNVAAGSLSTSTFGLATSTYNAGTGVWTVTGSVADVNAALAAVAFNPSANWDQDVTIVTRIRDAAGTGPVDGTISLNVTPVNDAPTATNLTQNKTATEGGSAVALDDIVVTDVDTGDTITATLTLSNAGAGTLSTGTYGSATSTYNAGTGVWMVQGSVADVNAALAAVAFTPSPTNDQGLTITTRIRDAAGTGPADGTISVTVTPVNDAPVVTTSGGSSTATEGSSVVVDSGITLTDPDNDTMASARVTITGNFQSGEDVLAFVNDGTTMGNIIASYNAGTGVLTLTSAGPTATLAQWQAALRSVTYENTSQDPDTADRTISVVVNDDTDDSAAAARTVAVIAVNDAPTITAPATIAATEGEPAAVTGISFSDVDAGSAAVNVVLAVPSGALSAASGAGVTVAGTSSTISLTGNIADINSFIAGGNVSYTAMTGGSPDVTLTVVINDGGNTGSGGAQQDSTAVSLSVTGAAPVVTDANISISGGSGTGGTFKIGDTVTATWDNSAGGDDNADITSVTFDFSQFGGGAAVSATNLAGIWTATHVLTAGAIDASNLNVSVTATNEAEKTTTTADSTNATVDTVVPLVASVAVPADGTYVKDDTLTFTVVLDDVVDVAGGSPRLAIDLNTGGRVYANYVSGSGTNTLTFDLVVSAGQVDDDGIEIAGLDANGATITDAVGNGADLTLTNVGSTDGVLLDAPAPHDGDGGSEPVTPEPPVDPIIIKVGSGDGEPITASEAAEAFVGGDSTDTVIFVGSRSEYKITRNDDGSYTIQGPHAPDTLQSIERLQFDDGVLALDIDGNPGLAFRLYQAAFDRDPDLGGLGYWIERLDSGEIDPLWMAQAFILSEEFSALYGDYREMPSDDFLTLLYRNILGRAPEGEGFAYWQQAVADGATYEWLLAVFSESAENQDNIAALIADGIWYL